MNRCAAPGCLVGGQLAGADVVYCADVAAVETDSGTVAEHVFPGWVRRGREEREGGVMEGCVSSELAFARAGYGG